MRRTSACLGLLFVMLGWCVDEPLQQRVSYDKPAQTLKTLLRDLSAQTNLKLYAAPPLDQEIVLVAVQEMPLKELMEHLAYAVDGEWIAEGEDQCALRSRSSSSARRTFKYSPTPRLAIIPPAMTIISSRRIARMLAHTPVAMLGRSG